MRPQAAVAVELSIKIVHNFQFLSCKFAVI